MAGGGGGGGRAGCESTVVNGGAGGNGDGNGANGNNAPTSGGQAGGGGGAIGQNFGVKGIGCGGFLGQDGTSGDALGQGGNGGNGQSCCCFSFASIPGGGGGGGGYLGGGGGGGGSAGTTGCSGNDKGAGGGGAGGTSYLGGLILSQLLTGVNSGNGQVIISYDANSTLEIDSLDITQPTCSIASAININASLVIAGNLDASDSVQVGRLNRFAVVSTCANPKSVPTLYSASGNRKFDLYSFPNNTGGTQCYEIRITDPGITKFMVAYLNKFDPTLVNNNYLGDPGSSGNIFMSVNVPNGDTLVLIVHEVNSGGGIGAYTLRIRNQSLFNFSANNGSTYSASSLISAVPGGNNNCRVKLVGTTCVSSPFVGKVRVVETSAVNQNLVTNYPNNLLLKHTTQSFFATNKISSPSVVTYKAGKAINLNPGFGVGTGAVFKAEIGGCTD
ncbi:MAG: hypothetical protein LCH67_13430 [Bacteroidetes bacterium]|nr:hypothetical protein [Bacteroidota bacterium]